MTETTTETKTGGVTRNGNVARVHEIADTLYAQHGDDLQRKMVVDQAASEGIPKATASAQWQKWRLKQAEPDEGEDEGEE